MTEWREFTCPSCGSSDFESNEQILGNCDIVVTEAVDTGDLDIEFSGGTDVDWDSQVTKSYSCKNCGRTEPQMEDFKKYTEVL